jgi:uncharacterized protein (DUF983 family)
MGLPMMGPRPESSDPHGLPDGPKKVSAWRQLLALLRLRCPRCRQGRLFRGWFTMNDPCPVCGLIVQREEGYFLMAMYVSYAIATVLLGGGYFLATWLLPEWHDQVILVGLLLLYVPLTPLVFRYSRTIWIHLDRWMSPTDVPATAYEKARAEQLRRDAGQPPGAPANPPGGQ